MKNITSTPHHVDPSYKYCKKYFKRERAIKEIEAAIESISSAGPHNQIIRYFIATWIDGETVKYIPIGLGENAIPLIHMGFQVMN